MPLNAFQAITVGKPMNTGYEPVNPDAANRRSLLCKSTNYSIHNETFLFG